MTVFSRNGVRVTMKATLRKKEPVPERDVRPTIVGAGVQAGNY